MSYSLCIFTGVQLDIPDADVSHMLHSVSRVKMRVCIKEVPPLTIGLNRNLDATLFFRFPLHTVLDFETGVLTPLNAFLILAAPWG